MRSISRQRQNGQIATKTTFPVGELFFKDLALQPFALPMCEVGVLNRQIRERWILSGCIGFVECRHFPHENLNGPAVRNYVVHRQQKDVLILAQTHERRSEKRGLRKVERHAHLFFSQTCDCGFMLCFRQLLQIDQAYLHRQCRRDDLYRLTLFADEAGS